MRTGQEPLSLALLWACCSVVFVATVEFYSSYENGVESRETLSRDRARPTIYLFS